MKKFLAIAVIAATLTSCGGSKTEETPAVDSTATVAADTTVAAPADTTAAADTTAKVAADSAKAHQ